MELQTNQVIKKGITKTLKYQIGFKLGFILLNVVQQRVGSSLVRLLVPQSVICVNGCTLPRQLQFIIGIV